ncbi:MAG TPA: hypothetical protein VJV78_10445 [Polyangiales bacterium]|nr:hypothetical protein [Polyangiales bacterium]
MGRGSDGPQSPTRGPGAGAEPGIGGAAGSAAAGKPATTDPTSLPPEVELTVDLQLPQASEHYVYAANPEAGTVAVIDATTQAIHSIVTGDHPTYLRTLAGRDSAIVLNVGSTRQSSVAPTASVIRTRDGASTSNEIDVVAGANAIGVAPDAKHAVVYYDSSYASAGASSGSFQDVSVLSLSADGKDDRAVAMTVGFRPRALYFADDGSRAFVVTEDGVSVLDFAQIERDGPGIARLVTFGDIDLKALDVAISPDGRYALARAEGQSQLHLAALDGSATAPQALDLASAYRAPEPDADAGVPEMQPVVVTDLDVLPDGSMAVAVLRNQHALLTIPLPSGFRDPSQVKTISVGEEIVGSVSVSNDAKHALLYTTAVEIERITIVALDGSSAPRTVALRKAVQAVAFTPDDKNALITHKRVDGDPNQPGISADLKLDRAFGYSLLRVASGDVKLQQTDTALGPIAMVPDSSFLFILFRNDATKLREVHRVSLASFLVDPITQLENPPLSIGTAAASKSVFINLQHPDGRMTFIRWDDPNKIKTVTGFELNSRIRN